MASRLARTATVSDCTAAPSRPRRWAARCTQKAPVPARAPPSPWRCRSHRRSHPMTGDPDSLTHRVLVIDDNAAIHQDYRKILVADEKAPMSAAEAGLFGERMAETGRTAFDVDSALQGCNGVELIWPFGVNRRERDACDLARRVLVRVGRVRTGWGTRRAELEATMDDADIRGLVTALRRSVAGLPRSSVGDHRGSMPT